MHSFHIFADRAFRKEIRRYLVLLLIPAVILIALYFTIRYVTQSQINNAASLTLDKFEAQSTSMLRELTLVSESICQSSAIEPLIQGGDVSFDDGLAICDGITASVQSSPYITHAYLVSTANEAIYTDIGLYKFNSFNYLLGPLGVTLDDINQDSTDTSYRVLNGRQLKPYCLVNIYNKNGQKAGTLFVALNMTEFLRIFYSMDAALCSIFNESSYIASYLKVINNLDWNDPQAIRELLNEDVECFYKEGDDWTYMVAISRTEFQKPLSYILLCFIVYAMLALGISFFYLFGISRKRYLRFSNMISVLPEGVEGDSYEEIFDRIRLSLENYSKQASNATVKRNERQLASLIQEYYMPASEEAFHAAGLPTSSYLCYVLITFFVDGIADPVLEYGQDPASIDFIEALFRTTPREVAMKHHIEIITTHGQHTYVSVLYGANADLLSEGAKAVATETIELLTSSYQLGLRATISKPVDNASLIPKAYAECLRLSSYMKSIGSPVPLISEHELKTSGASLMGNEFIRQEQVLIQTIISKKYSAVPGMVESILEDVIANDYTMTSNRIMSVKEVLIEGIKNSGAENIPDNYIELVSSADSKDELITRARDIYGALDDYFQTEEHRIDAVSDATGFIEQHLSDTNLNVAGICEAIGISPQRLTRMFQARFNMAIAEYMNYKRIELARELLKEPSLTVVKVSSMTGYISTDTFMRNFKKVCGVTPTEYRQSL